MINIVKYITIFLLLPQVVPEAQREATLLNPQHQRGQEAQQAPRKS